MSVIETVSEDEKKKDIVLQPDKGTVRFRGKDVKVMKLEKKVMHKPRLSGAILINLSILLMIIVGILIFSYMLG
ncbi:MAG: hypothetical protein ACFFAO_18675 [Candidatus Hermodarchaeota archaeon]